MTSRPWESTTRDAAAALRSLARRDDLKKAVLRSDTIFRGLERAAARFVAGNDRASAIRRARSLVAAGYGVTIDYMGENAHSVASAREATDEFLRLIDDLRSNAVPASVSLDLSHIGLTADLKSCFGHAQEIAAKTAIAGCEMMISMEESDKTDQILAIHHQLSERHDHIGITLQTRLERTPTDLATVLLRPGRIRLVKGAYGEPDNIASYDRHTVDARFRRLTAELLASGHPSSIATHDPAMIAYAKRISRLPKVSGGNSEFEMLDGVQVDLAERVRSRGSSVRKYVVYGREWYLYLLHRLAEHPPTVLEVLSDFVAGLPQVVDARAGTGPT